MSDSNKWKATAHLISGKVGSGKTTYARRLAAEVLAPVFSIDAWMANLYGPDVPTSGDGPIDFAWYAERVDRCEVMIWELSKQQLAQGRNVVLDLGFLRQARRQKFLEWVRDIGAAAQIHHLEVDVTTRRERVASRNRQRADTFSFSVTDKMFDFAESLFEPLTSDELARTITVNAEKLPA